MKKMFLKTVLGFCFISAFFAPFVVIADVTTGPTITAQQIESYRTKFTKGQDKIFMELIDELVKPANHVNNFDALKTFVINYCKSKNISNQRQIDSMVARSASTIYGKNSNVYSSEAYAFMKQMENQIFVYEYLNRNFGGFSNAKLFDEYFTALQKADISQAAKIHFERAVAKFIVLCPQVDAEKAKTALQTLNRIYSPYLLKNKEKWEPIIAQIRVALETY